MKLEKKHNNKTRTGLNPICIKKQINIE